MRVLIVEDEPRLAQALCQIVRGQKYMADVVHSGTDGLDYALSGEYEVIILDIMLPGMTGFDVARKLRENKVETPIIMLTARDEISDKVRGLDCGADDYMTKPFSPEELLARLRALSRRKGEVTMDELCFADVKLNLATNTLECGEKSVRLGFKEFEVMRVLMTAPGTISSKEELIAKVWGVESEAGDNNVEAYVSFLRKKLFFIGSGVAIEAVRKVGYRLEGEEKC